MNDSYYDKHSRPDLKKALINSVDMQAVTNSLFYTGQHTYNQQTADTYPEEL